jgi:predicted phage-related endonuclease
MKIIDIIVRKEKMADGQIGLACWAQLEDGSHIASASPWRNTLGMWASNAEEREPAEIAAHLRCFAKAIEEAAQKSKAA